MVVSRSLFESFSSKMTPEFAKDSDSKQIRFIFSFNDLFFDFFESAVQRIDSIPKHMNFGSFFCLTVNLNPGNKSIFNSLALFAALTFPFAEL